QLIFSPSTNDNTARTTFAKSVKLRHLLWTKSHTQLLSSVLQNRLRSCYLCPLSFAPPESGVFFSSSVRSTCVSLTQQNSAYSLHPPVRRIENGQRTRRLQTLLHFTAPRQEHVVPSHIYQHSHQHQLMPERVDHLRALERELQLTAITQRDRRNRGPRRYLHSRPLTLESLRLANELLLPAPQRHLARHALRTRPAHFHILEVQRPAGARQRRLRLRHRHRLTFRIRRRSPHRGRD